MSGTHTKICPHCGSYANFWGATCGSCSEDDMSFFGALDDYEYEDEEYEDED